MVKVSVVIPLYNGMKFINQLITALKAQTYKDVEYIIVNDGSTDRSGDYLSSLNLDTRFKIFNKTNGGVSSARNVALSYVTGQYVMFMDADDYPQSTMIAEYVKAIEDSKTDFVFFSADKITLINGHSMGRIDYSSEQVGTVYGYEQLAQLFGQQGVKGYLFLVISKANLWTAGIFNQNYKYQEDLAALANVIAHNPEVTATFKNESYYYYMQHTDGALSNMQVSDYPIFVTVADDVISQFDEQKISTVSRKILNGMLVSALMNILAVAVLSHDNQLYKKNKKRFLKEFKHTIIPNKKVWLRKYIQYIAVKFNLKFIVFVAYRKIFKV